VTTPIALLLEGNGFGNNYNVILYEGLVDKNLALRFTSTGMNTDEKSISPMHWISAIKYNVPAWDR
jgi:hypothetical protein